MGIEVRSNDVQTIARLQALHHQDTADCVLAERALNRRLQGGCQVPIACYAVLQGEQIFLRGLVGSIDGKTILRAQASMARQRAEALGIAVAEDLLAQGAQAILAQVYGSE